MSRSRANAFYQPTSLQSAPVPFYFTPVYFAPPLPPPPALARSPRFTRSPPRSPVANESTTIKSFKWDVQCALKLRPENATHEEFTSALAPIVRGMANLAEKTVLSFGEIKFEDALQTLEQAYTDLQCGTSARVSVCKWGASEDDVDRAVMAISKLAKVHLENVRVWNDKEPSFRISTLLIDAWMDIRKSTCQRPLVRKHFNMYYSRSKLARAAVWFEFVETFGFALERVNSTMDLDLVEAFLNATRTDLLKHSGWKTHLKYPREAVNALENLNRWSWANHNTQ